MLQELQTCFKFDGNLLHFCSRISFAHQPLGQTPSKVPVRAHQTSHLLRHLTAGLALGIPRRNPLHDDAVTKVRKGVAPFQLRCWIPAADFRVPLSTLCP